MAIITVNYINHIKKMAGFKRNGELARLNNESVYSCPYQGSAAYHWKLGWNSIDSKLESKDILDKEDMYE